MENENQKSSFLNNAHSDSFCQHGSQFISIRGEKSDKDALSSPIIPYHKKHCHIAPI